jgi:hypothetical protein
MPAILGQPPSRKAQGRRTLGNAKDPFQVMLAIQFPGTESLGSLKRFAWKASEFESACRAYSSVGLERTPDKREVGGSSPPRPTRFSAYRLMGL